MAKVKRVFALLTALLALMCMLGGCGEKVGAYSINERPVMTVNGFEVTFDEYKYFYYNHLMDLKNEDVTDFDKPENLQKLKERTEQSLRTKYTVMSLIDKYEIKLEKDDAQDVNDSVSGYIYEQGGEAKFRAWLADSRMTGNVFRDMLEYTFFYDVYLRELLMTGYDNCIKMDDATIKQDVMDNFYRYTQIFIEFGEGDNYVINGEKMNEAYLLLKSGEDFVEVAKNYSDWNVNSEKGVYATKGEKLWTIEKTALALEIGEYSEVVKSTEGHHIIKRLPLEESYVDKNLEDFEVASFTRRYHEYIDSLSKDAEVVYNKYYETISHDMLVKYELYEG